MEERNTYSVKVMQKGNTLAMKNAFCFFIVGDVISWSTLLDL